MRRIDEKDLIEMASEANQIESDNLICFSTAEVNNFKILQELSVAKKLESFFLNVNTSAERNQKFKRENYLCNMKFKIL